jgi:hypothetical protein
MADSWWSTSRGESNIKQGEVIEACEVIHYGATRETLERLRTRVIVLTQDCDIEQGKARVITVCPIFTLSEVVKSWEEEDGEPQSSKKLAAKLNDIAAKKNHRYVLLSSYHEDGKPKFLVDLYQPYLLPVSVLDEVDGWRKQLCSPYKEALSQSFANVYARVAYPLDLLKVTVEDIDDAKKAIYANLPSAC